MRGEISGAPLATFVLLNSECSFAASRLPGGSAVVGFTAIAGKLSDGFSAADFHGIQCLYHAAPAAVITSAVMSSARRKTPSRNPGVKFPLAHCSRLAFGSDLEKSNEGLGSSACSTAVNCVGTSSRSMGRGFPMTAAPGGINWSSSLSACTSRLSACTSSTTSRFDSTLASKSNCPGATAADNWMTPPFSWTTTEVVSSVNSSRSPALLPGCTPVAFTRTSCATIFALILGLGLDRGASTCPGSFGNSSSCGFEELAERGAGKSFMSFADDNSVVPCAGIARGSGQNSDYGEPSALRTVLPLHFLCLASVFAMVQTDCVPHYTTRPTQKIHFVRA